MGKGDKTDLKVTVDRHQDGKWYVEIYGPKAGTILRHVRTHRTHKRRRFWWMLDEDWQPTADHFNHDLDIPHEILDSLEHVFDWLDDMREEGIAIDSLKRCPSCGQLT